ncbi:MAG: hypothetical protein JRH14_10395 [Deltaproteobacteria bacterium]|nr:hypothetical protein [Deltaproteobacteria bacterium]
MAYASKGLVFTCLVAVLASGFVLPVPMAGAQEVPAATPDPPPSPETDAGAGTGTDTDTGADTGADTDAGADTDIGADTGADTDGPKIVLPPGEVAPDEPEAGSYRVEIDPLRGMQQGRMRREQKTTIGGYGELHLNMVKPEGESLSSRLDFHRFVLFFAHRFNERFQFYSEVELEHAFVAEGGGVASPGSIQIEQAFIDWRLLKGPSEALYLRAGAVLVPMGIVNQWHEPPIFNGVERPQVDRVIIPSTWREGGVGIWGQPKDEVRYEFYVMSGLDASGFSGSSGLRGGRLKITQAELNGPAFVGRIEWEPILGMVLGMSPYFGWAGPQELASVNVKVGGISGDWRVLRKGFESRAVIAYFHVSDTDALRVIPPGETDPTSTVGSNLFGAYGELGYKLLRHDVSGVGPGFRPACLRRADRRSDLPTDPTGRLQGRLPIRAPVHRRARESLERWRRLHVLAYASCGSIRSSRKKAARSCLPDKPPFL